MFKDELLARGSRKRTIFMTVDTNIAANVGPGAQTEDFAQRVRVNQAKLASELKPRYDFIVCGSGSSGSVVERRLAENLDLSVTLAPCVIIGERAGEIPKADHKL